MSTKTKNFGELIATALVSFVATNADDLVVLMNFFTESTIYNSSLKVRHIFIGQYVGFILLLCVSLIGYGLSYALPIQMLGFLGFFPIGLGIKGLVEILHEKCFKKRNRIQNIVPTDNISTVELEVIRYRNNSTGEIRFQIPPASTNEIVSETSELPAPPSNQLKFKQKLIKWLSFCFNLQVLKIVGITLANSADNVTVYAALFAQASSWQIILYIVIFLVMVLVWLLVSYFFINFRPILAIAQRYAAYIVPVVFVGIGIYIVISSECFPWLVTAIRTKNFRNG